MTKSFFLATTAMVLGAGLAHASTLEDVRERGAVVCGVTQGVPGFSNPDDAGNWTGFDVDICRAVAAAVLDDADAVRFVPLSNTERFTALQSGEVDILSRTTTRTLNRDTALGLNFAPVVFYDGQGFMVRESLGVASALDLDGASVCVSAGSTTELNLADYFSANGMSYSPVRFDRADEVLAAYDAGRCDVYTSDLSGLAARRLVMENPAEHVMLPETISKEPLAPVVRHGDDQWFDIVTWTVYALIGAEEMGVTSENMQEMAEGGSPDIRRLLGAGDDNMGAWMDLENDWSAKAIAAVGNYGELWERHLGMNTPLELERGLNELYTNGGIQYAMPIK
ncbi:amino acid ABC transporter substrate-binding protein [Roseinatronobacter alkalisoli]|uniref:Amino acid ABC transporter substrate-binding protein n=1 Tax=Roseinatronobacter alkalisoli TaxID=3028235 RepID=A0ABT5T675_9RHOB|nr:amino acid ABC transporter substrate-binding protein [Roseinatronobacter sp. HJB301]MDD7970617.1 amino acid ABC transporter substrate-binding protein [Roseinatronobacter sp. HJB301]